MFITGLITGVAITLSILVIGVIAISDDEGDR